MLIRRVTTPKLRVGTWVRHPQLGVCKLDCIVNYPGAQTATLFDGEGEKQYSRTKLLAPYEPRAVVRRRSVG